MKTLLMQPVNQKEGTRRFRKQVNFHFSLKKCILYYC